MRFDRAVAHHQRISDLAVRLARSLNRLGNWWLNTGQADEALAAHQEALSLFEGQKHLQGMAETLDTVLPHSCKNLRTASWKSRYFPR